MRRLFMWFMNYVVIWYCRYSMKQNKKRSLLHAGDTIIFIKGTKQHAGRYLMYSETPCVIRAMEEI